MSSTINKRIGDIINASNKNVREFAQIANIPQTTLNEAATKNKDIRISLIQKIANAYPNISMDWLITGKGDIYINKQSEAKEYSAIEDMAKTECKPMSGYMQQSNFRLIPLINMNEADGLENQNFDQEQHEGKYVPFIDAQENDVACPVTNNSMFPLYPPGCIVHIRKVLMWKEYIEYGQVYVIDLIDGRRLIKEVRKGSNKNHFALHSYNERYDDNEIPIAMINSIWLVVAKYEKNVM